MKKHLILGLAAMGLASLLSGAARANDYSAGWQGEDVVLMSESRVHMVSENIHIEQIFPTDREWHVDARYLFENLTDSTITITVAFPEPTIDTVARFENFRTLVRGVEVDYAVARRAVDSLGGRLGRSYVFDITFKPHERLNVRHIYGYYGSSWAGGAGVEYITRTGRSWQGAIDAATFTVVVYDLNGSSLGLVYNEEYNLIDCYRDVVEKESRRAAITEYMDIEGSDFEDLQIVRTVLTFQQRAWTPQHDFYVTLPAGRESIDACDDHSGPSRFQHQWFLSFPEHLRALVSRDPATLAAQLECLSDSALRYYRNVIYAAYGRPFANRQLNNQFYQQYHGWSWSEDNEDRDLIRYEFVPNSRYADTLLSPLERRFVLALRRVEERRRAAPGTAAGPQPIDN